jgi:hypothetical protein
LFKYRQQYLVTGKGAVVVHASETQVVVEKEKVVVDPRRKREDRVMSSQEREQKGRHILCIICIYIYVYISIRIYMYEYVYVYGCIERG